MTSHTWAEVVLALTLLAPLASVLVVMLVAIDDRNSHAPMVGCAAAAVGAGVLLVSGQHPGLSRLAPDDLAFAAIAGSALLALCDRNASRRAASAVALTIVGCGIAAGTDGRPSLVGPVVAIAGTAVVFALFRRHPFVVGACAVGALAAASGIRAGEQRGAVFVVGGVALVACVATVAARQGGALVVPAALVAGLRVAPLLEQDTARWVAIVLGAVGAALAIIPMVRPQIDIALGCVVVPWVLATAVDGVPNTASAARPLAAGLVLALALGGALAVLAAVPGAVILATTLATGHGGSRAAVSVALFVTIAGVALQRLPARRSRPRLLDALPAALMLWFVVRPTSWSWARAEHLSAYGDGVAIAAAAGVATTVALVAAGQSVPFDAVVAWTVDDRAASDRRVSSRVLVLSVAATVATGLAAAALVRSAHL